MLPLPAVWVIHLGVSLIYGIIISVVVARLTSYGAILVGGVLGLLLFFANWALVSVCWPAWRVDEIPVLFTHIVFGLIAAGAYRGLLRRQRVVSATP